ncbi:hypothetical protein DGM85_11495 [Xanthomonas phaseoli pv. phaseoli]|nr:hypothetical protein DGM93_11645 [Xanthomonas phaseoli pv. phaseoli]QWN29039.1 hypothetical protein DGM85_11495 [Xanthomonas phaseoli pv. phaseoli]QWN33209.1 hypothetical protein DGM81_11390 [Xanthomonas phaseoli pv. phaseoli]
MRVRFPGSCQVCGCQTLTSAAGGSAAGHRLFGAADILSDAPSRHIPVPLSANPRPRCRLCESLSR